MNGGQRARFRDLLSSLDEAQVKEIQADLKSDKRDIELMLNDTQVRLDYLGVFTPQNITRLARSCEKGEVEPPQNPPPEETNSPSDSRDL